MRVTALSPTIAAEVDGVDLSLPTTAEQFEALHAAWLRYLVLVFRGQRLSDAQLVAFSRQFGDLDRAPPNEAANVKGSAYVPDRPEVTVISNVVDNGVAIGALGDGEAEWHIDMSYNPIPPTASLLYSLEIPPAGGDTSFCNMYEAYESLTPALKKRARGLVAVHDATYTSAGGLRKGYAPVEDVREAPGARHPLVRTHPDTGRNALFLGRRRNSYVLGLPIEESEALLDALWKHATEPRLAYTHQWRVGDLVLWDNRCTMHRRDAFDPRTRRVMHRTQVKGDRAPAYVG